MRSTMDIDANITGINFTEEKIKELVEEIAAIDLEDNVTFTVDKSNIIREDNEYGGYSFKITGKAFNIIIPFHIDISTGDLITPKAVEYKYKFILEDKYIELYTYNYETIIAEKLQTVLSRNTTNSRMKDYYDLYYFVTNKWNEVDEEILNKAIYTTFKHRNTEQDLKDFDNIIDNILNSEIMQNRWKSYQEKFYYAKNIEFHDVIDAIKKIVGKVIHIGKIDDPFYLESNMKRLEKAIKDVRDGNITVHGLVENEEE